MATGARPWRACAVLSLLTAANTGAANWTFTPDITLRETYTDNAFIGTGPRREDLVTQITPGIRIDRRGPRLAGTFDYRPSARLYARHNDENDIANRLAAFARLEALEQLLFVEASGNVSQSFISPFAARPPELATVTPNRLETRTFSLSPYLRGDFDRGHEYELRNISHWTRTDERGLGEVRTRRWSGRVASPVPLFGWAAEYDDTRIEREPVASAPDQESRLFRGRLYFQPDPAWRFSASLGGEENNFVRPSEQRRERIYGAGVSWQPGPRTSAELEYEHRFFGPSRLARLNHRTRLTAWELSYSRNTSSFQEEVLRLPPGDIAGLLDGIFAARIPDPQQRRAAVEEFLRVSGAPPFLASPLSFFTQSVFLREAVNASLGILGVRNSITFTAFGSDSTRLSSEAAVLPEDALAVAQRITQQGFGARVDHKLTPFTTLGASATRSNARQEDPAGLDSRTDYFALTLNHTLSPRTTAFAGVSATRFDSEDGGVENQDANSIFAGLSHRF